MCARETLVPMGEEEPGGETRCCCCCCMPPMLLPLLLLPPPPPPPLPPTFKLVELLLPLEVPLDVLPPRRRELGGVVPHVLRELPGGVAIDIHAVGE